MIPFARGLQYFLCCYLISAMSSHAADISLAHIFFEKKNYEAALLALQDITPTLDSRWLAAESYFRLKQWAKAKAYYEEIFSLVKNKAEKKKADLRIFDVLINQHDLDNSISHYVSLKKKYGNLNGRIHYALGKALYDMQYFDQAKKIFN